MKVYSLAQERPPSTSRIPSAYTDDENEAEYLFIGPCTNAIWIPQVVMKPPSAPTSMTTFPASSDALMIAFKVAIKINVPTSLGKY